MLRLLLISSVFVQSILQVTNGYIPESLESECVNNPLLSSNNLWTCVKKEKCIPPEFRRPRTTVSCGTRKICCPSNRPTTRTTPAEIIRPTTRTTQAQTDKPITHTTPAQIEEANLVALNECHKYQGYRWRNYTDYGILFGDPIVDKSDLDCKEDIETLVVADGSSVHEKEYPFMALLGFDDDVTDEHGWKCGGTLISSQYILTAAHCIKIGVRENTLVKWALLGKLSRTGITQDLRKTNLFEIIEHIKHPLYKDGNSKKENNDIALLKLEQEVPLSSFIRPICLYHDQTMAKVNSKAIVAGWGVTVAGEIESDDLRKAPMEVLEEKGCVGLYKNDPTLQNGFDKTTMFCGGDLMTGKDACPGDSGGPLLIPIENYTCMYLQIGVISRGRWECGKNKPAIYTKVSHYLPWIRSVAWSST